VGRRRREAEWRSLANAEPQSIDHVGVRRFRRTQHELFVLEHVDEARVALHHGRDEVDDAVEHRMQGIGGGKPAADFVEEIDLRGGSGDVLLVFQGYDLFSHLGFQR
jgi:hypothetical protein